MEIFKIFREPKNKVVLNRNRLSLFERALPLARSMSVRYIATFGIVREVCIRCLPMFEDSLWLDRQELIVYYR